MASGMPTEGQRFCVAAVKARTPIPHRMKGGEGQRQCLTRGGLGFPWRKKQESFFSTCRCLLRELQSPDKKTLEFCWGMHLAMPLEPVRLKVTGNSSRGPPLQRDKGTRPAHQTCLFLAWAHLWCVAGVMGRALGFLWLWDPL